MSKQLHERNKGFTLIELMIVVAIIGILAAIAIPNFLRFQLKARSSEGKTNLAAIRTAEESYFAEYGLYVSSDLSPPTHARNVKTNYTHAVSNLGFDQVGWEPEGDVYFTYSAGISSDTAGFLASAAADIDSDGVQQVWGYHKPDGVAANVTGKSHTSTGVTAITCVRGPAVTSLTVDDTVAPCNTNSGNSVF
ncbi:MAG: prepilin-type N-terminal cleavage/methylation domain-containing protein [Myxococcota bacterium]